jgi:hypothetical protein
MKPNRTLMKYSFLLKALFFLALFFVLNNYSSAQLVVNGGGTPLQIVNAFVSSGLSVSNVTLNCGPNSSTAAYGTFTATSTNLGIPSGVLLTTGEADLAIGPNDVNYEGYCVNTIFNDPQLTAIEPTAYNDPCILEFDVVPHCDSLVINFAFGSEEYPEFVDAGYNDAFGFFVTGPSSSCDPGGYNNTNVAQLPNGAPVSIDNINAGYYSGCPLSQTGCMNCNYYTNNCGGTTIQYDGLTKPIYVHLAVCPCATYHWKIAIADAGDCVYDSGIFLNYLTSCSTGFNYTVDATAANCVCDGAASVNISAGVPPYTYTWSPGGQTTSSVSSLCPGTYTVSVTDNSSCGYPLVQTFSIVNNSPVSVTASHTNETCYGQVNATASVTPTGGNGPYTFSWTPGGMSTQTVSNLSAGTYTVVVTDANGCTSSTSVVVLEPGPFATNWTGNNINCFGNCTGNAAPNFTGGTLPYTYSWSPSGGTGPSASSLCAGVYTVSVTDASGCTGAATINIVQPAQLVANPTILGNVRCNGQCNGVARVQGSGGTPGYTYSWNTTPVQTTATVSNLCAGTYTAFVRDSRGCTSTTTVTVTEPPAITASTTSTDATCSSCSDGSITITAGGGTPGYTYSLSPNAGTLTGNTFNNVPPGNYNACVTDANNCSTCDSITVNFTVGIGSLISQQQIYFYPNPFSGETWLNVKSSLKGGLILKITDALGKEVSEISVNDERTLLTRKVLPAAGVYSYRLIQGKTTVALGKLTVVD